MPPLASTRPVPPAGTPLKSRSVADAALWPRLTRSEAVQRFQRSFTIATGLPVTLVPATGGEAGGAKQPEASGAFCIDGCMGPDSGAVCFRVFRGVEERATRKKGPVQYNCPSGLVKILVPVLVAGRHVGNVLVGPFSLQLLNAARLRKLDTRLLRVGLSQELERLKLAWRYTPTVTRDKAAAACALVGLFVQFLAESGNQLLLETASQQSRLLQQVEAFLESCPEPEVTLSAVARRVNLSTCYFCKVFKQQSGLTFSEYRVRRRIEQARRLLRNPEMRVSEAAFAAGFESVPYFNRAFRRYVGRSPTEYRRQATAIQGKKNTNQA